MRRNSRFSCCISHDFTVTVCQKAGGEAGWGESVAGAGISRGYVQPFWANFPKPVLAAPGAAPKGNTAADSANFGTIFSWFGEESRSRAALPALVSPAMSRRASLTPFSC